MSNLSKFALGALPLAIAAASAPALAVDVPETVTFGAAFTDTGLLTDVLPGNPCGLDQQLTKVVVTSSARGFGNYEITNNSPDSPAQSTVTQELIELSIKVPGLPGGEVLIDGAAGPFVSTEPLAGGQTLVVDPSFDETFTLTPSREYTSASDLAFFDTDFFDVNFLGDAEDSCQNTTGNSTCTIRTLVEGEVTVTYSCQVLEPALTCDGKTLSPFALDAETGTVAASFTIRNSGNVDLDGIQIVDSMGSGMELVPGSTSPNPPGDPVGGPPDYTWSGLALAQGESLTVTYDASIDGLAPRSQICNQVIASVPTGPLSTTSNACSACVTRPGDTPPPPSGVPAIGPFGLPILAAGLSGLGLLFGFRRRR